jgi:alpha-beta hydrolase superfamily lysophospholipase
MKPRVTILTLTLIFALIGLARGDCDLRSRGLVGFRYRDLSDTDRDSLGLPEVSGVVVIQIVPDSPAEQAGMKVSDIITHFDDRSIRDGSDLIGALRSYYAGDSVVISGLRGDESIAIPLTFQALPREENERIDIEYTCFETGGARLRAVMTSPLNSSDSKLPAMLIVSALGSPRLTGMRYYSLGRELAHTLAEKGFRVLRFELRGAGDSEGEDFRTTDFFAEVDDNLAALDYLIQRPDVDGNQVFVMGHSTGGMVAAVIAGQRDLAGLIVSCTIGRTFYERMFETLRFQAQRGGDSPEAIDEMLKDYLELTVSIASGDSLAQVTRRNPDLTQYVNTSGRIMDDRNADYWRQQLNLNLSETYSQVTEPVLIIYAASDFLTQLACHEHIRDVLVISGNEQVRLKVIPDLDHAYAHAEDKQVSYANYQTRDFKGNPEPIDKMVSWLNETLSVD